jgi:hypothetical protein
MSQQHFGLARPIPRVVSLLALPEPPPPGQPCHHAICHCRSLTHAWMKPKRIIGPPPSIPPPNRCRPDSRSPSTALKPSSFEGPPLADSLLSPPPQFATVTLYKETQSTVIAPHFHSELGIYLSMYPSPCRQGWSAAAMFLCRWLSSVTPSPCATHGENSRWLLSHFPLQRRAPVAQGNRVLNADEARHPSVATVHHGLSPAQSTTP